MYKNHNLTRLFDIRELREFYIKKGNYEQHAKRLMFWEIAYLVLIYDEQKVREEVLKSILRHPFDISSSYINYLIEKFKKEPFLLTNEKFKALFPESKILFLKSARNKSEKYRSRLRRIQKHIEKTKNHQDKHSKVVERRIQVIALQSIGKTVKEIAKELNVSVSTIEKDIKSNKNPEINGIWFRLHLHALTSTHLYFSQIISFVEDFFKKIYDERIAYLCQKQKNIQYLLYQ